MREGPFFNKGFIGFQLSYIHREKKNNKRKKRYATKGTSTNETKGPMQGATQVENLVQKAKNYTIISAYRNIKRKNLVCAVNDGMRTILQMTKCTGVPRQMLFAKGLSVPPFTVFHTEQEYKLCSFHRGTQFVTSSFCKCRLWEELFGSFES